MAVGSYTYPDFPDSLQQECHYSFEADISYNIEESGASIKALLSISLGLWSPCISCTLSNLDLPSTEGCDESSGFLHSSVVPFR